MRIFLTRGLALHSLVEPGDELDFLLIEGEAGRLEIAAIASLHELHDDGGRSSDNGHHLVEAIGGRELAVLDPQPLELHGAKELLDDPAPLVPSDDPPRVG